MSKVDIAVLRWRCHHHIAARDREKRTIAKYAPPPDLTTRISVITVTGTAGNQAQSEFSFRTSYAPIAILQGWDGLDH